jgi:hypothetical protein
MDSECGLGCSKHKGCANFFSLLERVSQSLDHLFYFCHQPTTTLSLRNNPQPTQTWSQANTIGTPTKIIKYEPKLGPKVSKGTCADDAACHTKLFLYISVHKIVENQRTRPLALWLLAKDASHAPSSQPHQSRQAASRERGAAARSWLWLTAAGECGWGRCCTVCDVHCHSYAMHAHYLCNGWEIKNGRHLLLDCQLEMFSLIFQQVTF